MLLILVFEAKHQVKEWSKEEELHINLICKVAVHLLTSKSPLEKLWRHTYHESTSFSLPPSIWYGASWVTNYIIEPSEIKNRACKTFSAHRNFKSSLWLQTSMRLGWLAHPHFQALGGTCESTDQHTIERRETQKVKQDGNIDNQNLNYLNHITLKIYFLLLIVDSACKLHRKLLIVNGH